MKHILALACATLILNPLSSPSASELPRMDSRSAPAQDAPFTISLDTLAISQQGDVELTCGSLSQEAASMRDVIYQLEDVKSKSKMRSHGVSAAGAVGSFLIGTVTGGIGLAVGGFLIDHNISEGKDEADAIQDVAEQRRTLMMGIFNAKGCNGPIEHAMQNPETLGVASIIAYIEPAAGEAKYQSKLRTPYNQ